MAKETSQELTLPQAAGEAQKRISVHLEFMNRVLGQVLGNERPHFVSASSVPDLCEELERITKETAQVCTQLRARLNEQGKTAIEFSRSHSSSPRLKYETFQADAIGDTEGLTEKPRIETFLADTFGRPLATVDGEVEQILAPSYAMYGGKTVRVLVEKLHGKAETLFRTILQQDGTPYKRAQREQYLSTRRRILEGFRKRNEDKIPTRIDGLDLSGDGADDAIAAFLMDGEPNNELQSTLSSMIGDDYSAAWGPIIEHITAIDKTTADLLPLFETKD